MKIISYQKASYTFALQNWTNITITNGAAGKIITIIQTRGKTPTTINLVQQGM